MAAPIITSVRESSTYQLISSGMTGTSITIYGTFETNPQVYYYKGGNIIYVTPQYSNVQSIGMDIPKGLKIGSNVEFFIKNLSSPTTASFYFKIAVPKITEIVAPTTGTFGTNVDIRGVNFYPNASVTFYYPSGIFVQANVLSTTRMIATVPYGASLGAHTVEIFYADWTTSAPSPTYYTVEYWTVGKELHYGEGGGTITNVEYSRNGGAWTPFTTVIKVGKNDLMSYRATFIKTSGKARVYGDIDFNSIYPNSFSISGFSSGASKQLTTSSSVKIDCDYTVVFNIQSI